MITSYCNHLVFTGQIHESTFDKSIPEPLKKYSINVSHKSGGF